MPSWFRARTKSQDTPADDPLIRVCLVSRDPALIEEVHEDLLVGFSTRGGYEFQSDHPDFQHHCDVLFVDLRAAGLPGDPWSPTRAGFARAGVEDPWSPARASRVRDPRAMKEVARVGSEQEGLAFIDAIRKSISHPPIVALCDADSAPFAREVLKRGAYETLTAPLNMPQLRLALQRAYEFRLAETKLANFLSEETAAHDRRRSAFTRKVRPSVRPAVAAPRPVRRTRPHSAPSRLAIGFVLGCVLFFAGLLAVRTILSGMGDALASAGFTADSSTAAPGANTVAGAHTGGFPTRRIWPLTASADFSQGGAFGADSARHSFRGKTESAAPARPHSSLPGYEPAALIERVMPRYSVEARAHRLQGTLRIRAVVGRDGVPRGLARVSGDPTLAQIAMDAVALWRYSPATLDGDPVESEVFIPIDFQLPD